MKFRLLLWALLLLAGSCQSQASARLKQEDSMGLDPAVRYGKLENGFTYYLRKIEDPENAVQFRLVVKAGGDHEDPDQQEYAHLLEHLLAKETRNFPNLKNYFYQDGRRRHAFTRTRSTEYFATIPRNNKNVFEDGIQILLDWAQGNEWKPESIAVERGAIEGEMRTTNPYGDWKIRRIEQEILETLGYNPFDTKESQKSIKNFNSKAFYRFYKDWYRPDLQAAIIVGDINLDSLERVIREKFEVLKNPSNPPDPEKYLEAQTVNFDNKTHFSVINDSLEPNVKLEIIRVRPNLEKNLKSKADLRNMLLQQLYMDILNKRSKNIFQQYDPPFSYFWADYRSRNMAGGQVNATLMSLDLSGDIPDMKDQFQRGVKSWKQLHLKISKVELGEAKKEILAGFNFDQAPKVMEFAIKYNKHFVEGKPAQDPEAEEELIKGLLKKITLNDLQTFVHEKGNLKKNIHFIFFKNNKTEMPAFEVFKKWKKEVDSMHIEPIQAAVSQIESLEDVARIPPSLSIEDIDWTTNKTGVSTVKLPNGIKIFLKPSRPSAEIYKNRIKIQALRPNPVPLENSQKYLAAQVAPEIMLFSGAGPYSKYDLESFRNKKRINLGLLMNKDNQIIFAESYVTDLPELLNLLYLYLTRPREDNKAFEIWKETKNEELEGKKSRGSASFVMNKIEPLWYPQLPILDREDLQQLSKEEVYDAVKRWFSSIEGYTFIVTGDFEIDTVLPVLTKKLSGFPTKEKVPVPEDKNFDFPLVKMKEELEFKNIDAAFVQLFFPVKVQNGLKAKIELKLLNRALNERIHDRLRKGSYSPVAQDVWVDEKNQVFAFKIVFDSALGEEENMINWALEEFKNLREHGVDKEWLKTAIHEELRSYEGGFNDFSHNDFWQRYLQGKTVCEDDLEKEVLEYGTILEHFVSLQDVNRAAKRYLKDENLQQFVALPERKF